MSLHTPPQSYMLRDIVEVAVAPSVSWLPQTIGWKVLAFVLLGAFCLWVVKQFKIWHSNRYRREALNTLNRIAKACHGSIQDPAAFRRQVSCDLFSVMKAALRVVNPKGASLYGASFLQALDAHIPENSRQFEAKWSHWMRGLMDSQYVLNEIELLLLLDDCQRWVGEHHAFLTESNCETNSEVQNV
ncbi:DUF4381 domain-containing protein [Vibrio ezurae]|uniref:DUF4381 domain-containing protein n=1 Tax=Vibrio ezurae NBRC 102218 TaxID=1219080 RepID=U3CFD0_9VIBR|nr:DUF4381 domain-containing protein [Vibrio ezurae]GAD79944.1 hypothetical protein VEZ01S_21_00660 [Vibrio ezurae NBRC 102218]